MTPGIDAAAGDEEGHPGVVELAVREGRAGVAGAAVAFADEDAQAALRRLRIARHRARVAARERVAEIVERRASRDERFLKGGERLAERGDDLRFARGHGAERFLETAGKRGVAAHHGSRLRHAAAHLARLEDRADALCPERVARAVPAEPAAVAHVHHARRVALDLGEAERARARVLPAAKRRVAGRAQHLARGRQARLEEEPLAELDRRRISRGAIGRIRRPRRGPRSVAKDRVNFFFFEFLRKNVQGEKQPQERKQKLLHSMRTLSVRRSPPTSKTNSQRPGM